MTFFQILGFALLGFGLGLGVSTLGLALFLKIIDRLDP